MKILDRYIGVQVISTICIVIFALLGVDMFFYLVNELRSVGHGDYTLGVAISYILLILPRKLYVMFPWAALLGSLLALGNMSKHSELVAMRAATVSVIRITWAALKAGIILTSVMFFCGEVIAPHTERYAQHKKTTALSQGQAMQTKSGTWVRHNDEFIHVGTVNTNNTLQNVTRYKFDEQLSLQEIEHANSVIQTGSAWNLYDVLGTKFGTHEVVSEKSDLKHTSQLLDSEVLQTSMVKHLECLTIIKLWRVIKTRTAQDLNVTEYQRAFWLKMMQPIAALVMVFLAVPFAFGPMRSSSMGLKLLVGILMGFGFHTLNSIFGPLTAVVGLSPMLAAFIPASVFFIFGYYMLSRVR